MPNIRSRHRCDDAASVFAWETEVNVKRHSIVGGLWIGEIAGAAATWAMDLVTTGMQQSQSREDAEQEKQAQANGKSSVENLLELLESRLAIRVDDDLRPIALQALHYGLGIGPGALYGVFRGRLPLIGAGHGLLFGAL